jgi:presenilin-like A22 family membrane protease
MKSNQPQKQSKPQSVRRSYNKYLIFSALAFQWIGVFVLLSLGGNWLDKRMEHHFPIFTLLGVFLALFVIFYTLFKFVNRPNGDS